MIPALTTFKLSITSTGKEAAEGLIRLMRDDEATWQSLHPVIRLLWESSPSDVYLLRFLAAAALREDGSFMGPDRLVHFITHLRYAARAFCTVEALHMTGVASE